MLQGGAEETHVFQMASTRQEWIDDVGRQPADSSDNAVSVAMAHWNIQHCVFAIEQFPQHVISRFGDVSWLPHSPDLLIWDFFYFCGYTSSVECTQTDHARSKS